MRLARLAGALYLIIIVFGIGTEVGIRGSVIVPDDAAATAANITAGAGLLRLGFLTDSLVFLADAALAVLLYLLLRPGNQAASLTAAAFRLVQTAVLALNLLLQHAAVLIQTDHALAFPTVTRDALAVLALDLHGHGYDLGLLFFGVHCLLVGWLIVRSGFLPKVLGQLAMAAGATYLIGSYLHFLAPAWVDRFAPVYVVALVAELGLCLWLLLRGVDRERWMARDRGQEAII